MNKKINHVQFIFWNYEWGSSKLYEKKEIYQDYFKNICLIQYIKCNIVIFSPPPTHTALCYSTLCVLFCWLTIWVCPLREVMGGKRYTWPGSYKWIHSDRAVTQTKPFFVIVIQSYKSWFLGRKNKALKGKGILYPLPRRPNHNHTLYDVKFPFCEAVLKIWLKNEELVLMKTQQGQQYKNWKSS